jgi:hypothetical protein
LASGENAGLHYEAAYQPRRRLIERLTIPITRPLRGPPSFRRVVDVETESSFPQRMSQQPDCQRCEPLSPYLPKHKAPILVLNVLTREQIRVCVVCLQNGVGLEELELPSET